MPAQILSSVPAGSNTSGCYGTVENLSRKAQVQAAGGLFRLNLAVRKVNDGT